MRLAGIRLLMVLTAVVGALSSGCMLAQDDPNDVPLGDIARNLRKKNPPSKPVIDDDNLSRVMQQGDDGPRSGFRYLVAGETQGFRLAAPDVTCSLSFSANVKSLLNGQYAQMDLPVDEMGSCKGRLQSKAIHLPYQSSTAPTGMSVNWRSR